jgi:hypothetical protein
MIWAIVTLLGLVLIMVIKQTISTSRLSSPPIHPIEEEEQHLFAERPVVADEEPKSDLKIDQKNIVITELMVNGTISFDRAKELGVKRLAGVIFRLRKSYKIDNIVVDGKFSHYKLVKYKG